MKKLLLMAVAAFIGASTFAQETLNEPISNPVSVTPKSDTAISIEIPPPSGKYLCAHCGLRMEEPGKCSVHNFTLVEKGHYYCENCDGVTSKKPGKCPKCQKDLLLMKNPDKEEIKEEAPKKEEKQTGK